MKPHPRMMTQAAEISLGAGKKHLENNNHPAAALSYNTAIQCLLSAAVNAFDSVTDGVNFLAASELPDILHPLSELELALADSSSGSGVYGLIVSAHVASLLKNEDAMSSFLRSAQCSSVQENASHLWRSYSEGFTAIVAGDQYRNPTINGLRDLEKYWYCHLEFISTATLKKDLVDACEILAACAAKKNADRTLRDDGKRIEGTGGGPVQWDFRIASWDSITETRLGRGIKEIGVEWPFRW